MALTIGAVAVGVGVAIVTVPQIISFLVALQRLTGAISIEASDIGRLDLLREAARDLTRNPLLGIGFTRVRDAHDIYVQLWHGGGLLALAAFALFSGGTLWEGARQYRQRRAPPIPDLIVALMISLFVWLFIGLVQNAIYDRYLYLPAALIITLRAARIHEAKTIVTGAKL